MVFMADADLRFILLHRLGYGFLTVSGSEMEIRMKSIYSDDYIHIISILRAVRKKKNITQSEMASLLNVTQSFISKVENCERRLDVIEFLSWTDALEISVLDVLPNRYIQKESYLQ